MAELRSLDLSVPPLLFDMYWGQARPVPYTVNLRSVVASPFTPAALSLFSHSRIEYAGQYILSICYILIERDWAKRVELVPKHNGQGCRDRGEEVDVRYALTTQNPQVSPLHADCT